MQHNDTMVQRHKAKTRNHKLHPSSCLSVFRVFVFNLLSERLFVVNDGLLPQN